MRDCVVTRSSRACPVRRRKTACHPCQPAALLLLLLFGCNAPPHADPPPLPELGPFFPDTATAIRELTARIKRDSSKVDDWLDLAMVYDAHEQDALARACYQRVLVLDAAHAKARYLLGLLRVRAGEVEGATADFRQVTKQNPSFAPGYWRSGLLLLEEGQLDAADALFSKAIDADKSDAVGWIGRARVSLDRGNPGRAVQLLEGLLYRGAGVNGEYVVHLLRTALRQAGMTDQAESLPKAVSGAGLQLTDPWADEVRRLRTSVESLIARSEALMAAGRSAEAIHLLTRVRAWKDESAVRIFLALAYRLAGRVDDSVQLLREVLAEDPGSYWAHFHLAVALFQSEQNAPAMDHVEQALVLNPTFAKAHNLRGDLLQKQQQPEAALAAYREASRCERGSVLWASKVGRLEMKLQQWQRAAETFGRIIKLNPRSPQAHYSLGIALTESGQHQAALESLRTAVNLDPGDRTLAEAVRTVEARLQP